ncbi:spermatogenesis-associated protein 4 [Gracilinanus agilis]|uniref:spermatogenesis-associated protein 4 n=1 Tax=Gracilinanus agilis TaxID=191870 RepID=UPI001CFD838D|nr:spermatogenesis-associated protein 4 [Gracilinanus agilis]
MAGAGSFSGQLPQSKPLNISTSASTRRRKLILPYWSPPKKSRLPRAVLRWLQSMDLTFSPKNINRDFSNGFLLAEIFSIHYPRDLKLAAFGNGTSIRTKLANWSQLESFFAKKHLKIPKELIHGTLHCKPGVPEILIQEVYMLLTKQEVKSIQDDYVNFTDCNYQINMPLVPKATVSSFIKSNIRLTELLSNPNILSNQLKIDFLCVLQMLQRRLSRKLHPKWFDIKPTIGELSLPPAKRTNSLAKSILVKDKCAATVLEKDSNETQVREIHVKQGDKEAFEASVDPNKYLEIPLIKSVSFGETNTTRKII